MNIWALSCIVLEFLIWLLYGWQELAEFHQQIRDKQRLPSPFYEEDTVELGKRKAKVHGRVVEWMGKLSRHPLCQEGTAMRDMLELVRTRLLVVRLPVNIGRLGDGPTPDSVRLSRRNTIENMREARETSQQAVSPPIPAAPTFADEPTSHDETREAVVVPDIVVDTADNKENSAQTPVKQGDPEQHLCRAKAFEVTEKLQVILDHKDESYWLPSHSSPQSIAVQPPDPLSQGNEREASDAYETFSSIGSSTIDSTATRAFDSGTSTHVDSGQSTSSPTSKKGRDAKLLAPQVPQRKSC